MENYFSLSREEVLGNIPMMFITFPSAKDPTANIRHPGNRQTPFVASILKMCLMNKSCWDFIDFFWRFTSLKLASQREKLFSNTRGSEWKHLWHPPPPLTLYHHTVLQASPAWPCWPWLATSGLRNGKGRSLEREAKTTWIWRTAWPKSCWTGHSWSFLSSKIRYESMFVLTFQHPCGSYSYNYTLYNVYLRVCFRSPWWTLPLL